MLSALLALALVLSLVPAIPIMAQAYTYGDYTYSVSNRTATITDFSTKFEGELVIPATLGGYPVTAIGEKAFYNCNYITGVAIPECVTSIGDWAFFGCSSLLDIAIPDGVTDIGEGAFSCCFDLCSISIPESVTAIGNEAFYGCGLTSVELPSNLTSVGTGLFRGCDDLVDLRLSGKDETYSLDSDGVLFNKEKTELVCSLLDINGTYVIPEGVTSIGDYAFYSSDEMTEVIIPQSVTSIGEYAFAYSDLACITIPGSVAHIGDCAFQFCKTLTDVVISEGVTSIGDYAFNNCKALPRITLPRGITDIGEDTFAYCYQLSEVVMPEGITSIGGYAFYSCERLSNIVIPESVTDIGRYAFRYSGLTHISIPAGVATLDSVFVDCRRLTDVVFLEGVTKIDASAFYGCTRLKSIALPSSMRTVDSSAFYDCTQITDVWYAGEDRSNISIGDYGNTGLFYATWHYNCCDPSSHSYDNACDTDCNTCGYVRTVPDHVYTNSCDADCNECGVVRSAPHTYDHACDMDCNACGEIRVTTHRFDNDCDTDCNVCAYTRVTQHVYDGMDDLTCNVCKYSLPPSAPTLLSNEPDTIALAEQAGLEYSKDGINWQKSNVFAGLSHRKTYTFYQRVAQSQTAFASVASQGLTVTTVDKYTRGAPEDFTYIEVTDTSVRLNEIAGCEYSMDGTYWEISGFFTGLVPGTEYAFYQRTAETSRYYASANAVLHITTCSGLGTVTYDANGGQNAPGATTGTISNQAPIRSGYQFVGWALSADGDPIYHSGDSYSRQEDVVLYAVWAEPCDTCGGKEYYYRNCSSCSGTGIGSTARCSSCDGKGSVYIKVSCPGGDCYNGKIIVGSTVMDCPICKGDGIFEEPSVCGSCNGERFFVYPCGSCNGEGRFYIECSQCTSGIQKFTPGIPQKPKLQSVSNKTVVLEAHSTYEYSLGGSQWQDSNVFTNLKANTQYAFYQRNKATTYTNQSAASSALFVTTLKERLAPPQPPVLQSKTFREVILEKTAGCEYSMDGINWQSDNIFDDLRPSTKYTFYCRYAQTDTHLCSTASAGLTVITEESPLYTVEFVDWDGRVIETRSYRYGDNVTAPDDPIRAAGECTIYVFAGWDKQIVSCTGDTTYTAVYTEQHIHKYAPDVVLPTCTDQGYTTHTCPCGDSYVDSYAEALGHNMQDLVCSVCGYKSVDLEITTVTLRADCAGVYYTGSFRVEEGIRVARMGIAVSLTNPKPVADGSDLGSLWTRDTTSVVISHILKANDPSNAHRAAMPIYARAYAQLEDGTYIYSEAVSINLRQVAEAADSQWDTLDAMQKEAVRAMYVTFREELEEWNLPNLKRYN